MLLQESQFLLARKPDTQRSDLHTSPPSAATSASRYDTAHPYRDAHQICSFRSFATPWILVWWPTQRLFWCRDGYRTPLDPGPAVSAGQTVPGLCDDCLPSTPSAKVTLATREGLGISEKPWLDLGAPGLPYLRSTSLATTYRVSCSTSDNPWLRRPARPVPGAARPIMYARPSRIL